jgi:hypothetical protein
MPNAESTLKIPFVVVILLFISALGSLATWVYAEQKNDDAKVADLVKKAALTDQTLVHLTEQLRQLNENLRAQKETEERDATNAMLRRLLENQGTDPTKVIEKAKKKAK